MPPTPTVHLRNIQPSDLPALWDFQLDPEANRMAVANPRSREAFDAHWAGALAQPPSAIHITKAIIADDLLVGSIGCFPMLWDEDQSTKRDAVGYWLARSAWGRGIATRALSLLLHEVPIRPIYARAAAANLASIRVLQNCGFTITGRRHSPATDRFPACEEAELMLR